jgi:hypothetical protein
VNQSQNPSQHNEYCAQAATLFSAWFESMAGWESDCGEDGADDCDSLTLSASEVVYNSAWNGAGGNAGADSTESGYQEAEI